MRYSNIVQYKFNKLELLIALFISSVMFILNPIYLVLMIFFFYPAIKEQGMSTLPFLIFIFLAIASRDTGITFANNVGDDAIHYFDRYTNLQSNNEYFYNLYLHMTNHIFDYEPVWYIFNYPATFFVNNIDQFRDYNYFILAIGFFFMLRKEPKYSLSIFFISIFFLTETVYAVSHIFRQVWASSFLVFAIYAFEARNLKKLILYSILSVLSHMSALPIVFILWTMSFYWNKNQHKILYYYLWSLIIFACILSVTILYFSDIFPRISYLKLFDFKILNSSDLIKLIIILLISSIVFFRILFRNKIVSLKLIILTCIVTFISLISLFFPPLAHRYLVFMSIPISFFLVLFIYEFFNITVARVLIFIVSFFALLRTILTEPGFFPLFFDGNLFLPYGLIFQIN